MLDVQQNSNKALIGLVLGILSIVVPVVGVIFAVIGIIISNQALKEVNDFETSTFLIQAKIGRICSFFGMWFQLFLVFSVIITVLLLN